MNYNDIAALLASGRTADDIAKEFTDALNKAVADEKAKKEAEAKAANEAKSKKMDEISHAIAHALNEYAMVAGIANVSLRGADVRGILDEFLPVIEQFKDVKVHVAKADPKATKKALKTADDVFNWFFKELGI